MRNIYICIEPEEFLRWLGTATPKSKLVYASIAVSSTDDSVNVATMVEAREAYLRGEIYFVQKRSKTGFDLLAIMRREVEPPQAIFGRGARNEKPPRGRR